MFSAKKIFCIYLHLFVSFAAVCGRKKHKSTEVQDFKHTQWISVSENKSCISFFLSPHRQQDFSTTESLNSE